MDKNQFKRISKLISESDRNKDILECPICRCENVHIVSVGVIQDGNAILIDYEGVKTFKQDVSARGSIINIIYCCENGCDFVIKQQFHKGNTYLNHALIENEGIDLTETLWRD